MDRRALIIVGLLVLLSIGGGIVAVKAISKREMARLLREAFERHGMPGAWGEALGLTESGLDLKATNLSGPDGARGGAWGPTQITEKTLKAHGFTFPASRLTEDPQLAADTTARIAAAGKPLTIEDLGAWWNAGRKTFAALPGGHVTRVTYVPRLVKNLGKATA